MFPGIVNKKVKAYNDNYRSQAQKTNLLKNNISYESLNSLQFQKSIDDLEDTENTGYT